LDRDRLPLLLCFFLNPTTAAFPANFFFSDRNTPMAITTAISASAAAPNAVKGEPASPAASSSSNDTEAPKTNDAAASTPTLTGNTAPAGTPPKRRAARRANTAERRATHNAVERMRRETLNGRFLVGVARLFLCGMLTVFLQTLASLLPPLAALRRPSKAAIVSSRCVYFLRFPSDDPASAPARRARYEAPTERVSAVCRFLPCSQLAGAGGGP
jgi:hypothetical protein